MTQINLPEILKKEATIALPRHDGEMLTNIFLAFILVLIVLLHSVSLGMLSLSQDLINYIIILTWHCNYESKFVQCTAHTGK